MPLTKDITFKCPECGEEIPLTLWQSVNTAENPKEAEALAYGDLFYIQCPRRYRLIRPRSFFARIMAW